MKNIFLCCVLFFLVPGILFPEGAAYDPLKVPESSEAETLLLTVRDSKRNRDIPIKVYLPLEKKALPVILFSHGLGGNRENSIYLGKHWSLRGYLCVFMQHPGSDSAIWENKPLIQRMKGMKSAASPENFMLRVKDVPAVLDQLEEWNQSKASPLYGRMDMSHVGMSGHSFGAVTTEAVSGQHYPRGISFTDLRIQAAVVMSPSKSANEEPKESFGAVKIPWMLMTGTKDLVSMFRSITMEDRLAVYPALPPGGKYEVVLNRAEHSAFTDRYLGGDQEERNPNHHRVILGLSTAFWDSYLKNEGAAKGWLEGEGARNIMEKEDRWQKK